MQDDLIRHSHILVVDDQTSNVCLLQALLQRLGFVQVRALTDSYAAMEVISEWRPDLLVLDLNMPGVSGFDILQMLAAAPGARDSYLPVLVLTADATAATKRKALAAGATDFLCKPFDSSEVYMRIRNLLKTRILHLQLEGHNAQLELQVAARTGELSEALADLKRTQNQMLQQERLRAFSEMAGGVVHDFNNALMCVIGYSDLLLQTPGLIEDPEIVREYLTTMNTAGHDAAHVVSRLRDFYRPRDEGEIFAPVELNKILEQVVPLTQPKWRDQALATGRTISLLLDLEKLPVIQANEAELRELATNLVFNAVDAMPYGGNITLRTRSFTNGVTLEVIDAGTGMSEEIRTRCLEPFFSTKGEGGTGLGLSMVFGIIQRHGGTIDIESAEGAGTTFRICLPLGQSTIAGESVVAEAVGKKLRVLVVDDEPNVRTVLGKYLEADGHEVATANTGMEGLAQCLKGPAFDILLTDQAMPGMTGRQLAVQLRAMRYTGPIILLTGFGGLGEEAGEGEGINLVLEKPVRQSALRQAVAELVRAG